MFCKEVSGEVVTAVRCGFDRCMTAFPNLGLTLLLGTTVVLQAQTSDLPRSSDFKTINRPSNSFIAGAMHIDNDEYAVPVGPVERSASHLGKTSTVTGPIDTLVYTGPTTASSLTTYTNLTSQLTMQGYEPVWSCSRVTCGSAFTLMQLLSKSVLDATHGEWGHAIISCLYAANDDIRYGSFRKADEYVLVLASLSPGNRSGALVVRVNGVDGSALQAASQEKPQGAATNATAGSNAGDANSTARTKAHATARSIFDRITH